MAEAELVQETWINAVQGDWLVLPITKPWSSLAAAVDRADQFKLGFSVDDNAQYRVLVAFPVKEDPGDQPENTVTLDQLEQYTIRIAQLYARAKLAYDAEILGQTGAETHGF